MSYEGYEMWLCEKGHLHTFSAWNEPERETWVCPDCAKKGIVSLLAWVSCVDETNGADETGHCPGYVELEVVIPTKTCTCKECGHTHVVEEPTYKIPENEGNKVEIERNPVM